MLPLLNTHLIARFCTLMNYSFCVRSSVRTMIGLTSSINVVVDNNELELRYPGKLLQVAPTTRSKALWLEQRKIRMNTQHKTSDHTAYPPNFNNYVGFSESSGKQETAFVWEIQGLLLITSSERTWLNEMLKTPKTLLTLACLSALLSLLSGLEAWPVLASNEHHPEAYHNTRNCWS